MRIVSFRVIFSLLFAAALPAADESTFEQISRLIKNKSTELSAALAAASSTDVLRKGTAVLFHGPSFVWAIETEKAPRLIVNDEPGPKMTRWKGSNLWIATGELK